MVLPEFGLLEAPEWGRLLPVDVPGLLLPESGLFWPVVGLLFPVVGLLMPVVGRLIPVAGLLDIFEILK